MIFEVLYTNGEKEYFNAYTCYSNDNFISLFSAPDEEEDNTGRCIAVFNRDIVSSVIQTGIQTTKPGGNNDSN